MNMTCIFFGILFCIGGGLFAIGKIHPHLAAWKNMSEEEKSKVDILPLCRNVGEVIFLSGLIFLVSGFCPMFLEHLFSVCMILWLVGAGLDIWYIGKSKRYKKQ